MQVGVRGKLYSSRLTALMPTPGQQLLADIRRAAAGIDPAKVSNSKWLPVDAVLAEALQLPNDDVYTCTISKSGNVAVRFQQSDRAANASVVVAAYNGSPQDLAASVDAAARRQARQPRDLVLFFLWPSWSLAAVIKPLGSSLPSVIQSAGPSTVLDV